MHKQKPSVHLHHALPTQLTCIAQLTCIFSSLIAVICEQLHPYEKQGGTVDSCLLKDTTKMQNVQKINTYNCIYYRAYKELHAIYTSIFGTKFSHLARWTRAKSSHLIPIVISRIQSSPCNRAGMPVTNMSRTCDTIK